MKMSIRNKIFLSFALVLLLNIIATLLFGNYFMERLYLSNKTDELKAAYTALSNTLNARDYDLTMDDTLAEQLYEIEKNNITILLFQLKENQQTTIAYFSRDNNVFQRDNSNPPNSPDIHFQQDKNPPEPGSNEPLLANPPANEPSNNGNMGNERNVFGISRYTSDRILEQAAQRGIFSDNAQLPQFYFGQEENTSQKSSMLDYYTQLNDNTYLFLMTPQEPITLAATLAVKYNLLISLVTFLVVAIMSYFVSRKITRPIEEIDAAARRISQRDFSQVCHISTGDELENLSNNINLMTSQLQDYINQLELNQQLLARDLAREAATNKMRREFIANVSHDFKTPLTLIRAYTETLLNQELSQQEKTEYCQIILNEVARMNKLVTQLLQLSKLESGMVTLERTLFPIDELIREILHHNQLRLREQQLQLHYLSQQDHIVDGDYSRIEQVLVNLIENAIKYCSPQGNIYINILDIAHSDNYRITITNSVVQQLPPEQLDNLFINFYKADESRQLENQSFGLGLAIVRLTMEMHHQPYGVHYVPEGIQFWFELPGIKDDDMDSSDDED